MKKLVKEFIESNIELIEDKEYYDDLYDQAYEWLPDEHVTELTKILTETLGVDFELYAKENIMSHFNTEINNFVSGKHDTLTLATFVRMYMNHINGLDWDEFQMLVEKEFKDSKLVEVYDDGAGNLYISRK